MKPVQESRNLPREHVQGRRAEQRGRGDQCEPGKGIGVVGENGKKNGIHAERRRDDAMPGFGIPLQSQAEDVLMIGPSRPEGEAVAVGLDEAPHKNQAYCGTCLNKKKNGNKHFLSI